MPAFSPADIDDANLLYYYTAEQTLYGPYYRLNQTKEDFPIGFYGSERDIGRGQASTTPVEPSWASKTVSHFRIVAHTMGPVIPGGQLSQNHWTIYMLINTGSVQLNMQLANTDSDRGKLVVKEHAYTSSNTAVHFWDIPALQDAKASAVYSLILAKGRDKYNMAEGGVRCRWWVLTVMRDIVESGFVEGIEVEQFLPSLSYNYSRNVAPIPLEMKQGTFF